MTEPQHDNTEGKPVSPSGGARRLLLRAAMVLAVVAFLSASAGSLLSLFARDSWRLELFCHFRVQYFWLLAAALVVFALRRRWLLLAAAAAFAVANAAQIVPLYFGRDVAATDAAPVRIMSLNVHFLNRDFDAVLDLIRRDKPAVIFLMEVTPAWIEALKVLHKEYPYEQVMPKHDSAGIALYSHYKIVDLEVKKLSQVGLPTLVAGIELPGGRLTLLATHPASPGSAANFRDRNLQLAEVAQLARERSGPVMLVGDMNTTSWSPYFQDMLRVSGLRDSRYGFGVEPTWPWFPLPLRIPIDHCLVSPEVTVLNRRVGPAVGSDHRPILVDFAL